MRRRIFSAHTGSVDLNRHTYAHRQSIKLSVGWTLSKPDYKSKNLIEPVLISINSFEIYFTSCLSSKISKDQIEDISVLFE